MVLKFMEILMKSSLSSFELKAKACPFVTIEIFILMGIQCLWHHKNYLELFGRKGWKILEDTIVKNI